MSIVNTLDFFTGAGTGIVASCLFSPDSTIRTAAIIVGLVMIGIGWYGVSWSMERIKAKNVPINFM